MVIASFLQSFPDFCLLLEYGVRFLLIKEVKAQVRTTVAVLMKLQKKRIPTQTQGRKIKTEVSVTPDRS